MAAVHNIIRLISVFTSSHFHVIILTDSFHSPGPEHDTTTTHMQELKESFNYGLFQPPSNGKAGKFLDEERRLGDYPFSGPVGYLEVSSHLINIFNQQRPSPLAVFLILFFFILINFSPPIIFYRKLHIEDDMCARGARESE